MNVLNIDGLEDALRALVATRDVLVDPPNDAPSPAFDPFGIPYTIATIAAHACRWPLGEVSARMPMCGNPIIREGKPYCEYHMDRAFDRVQTLKANEAVTARKRERSVA